MVSGGRSCCAGGHPHRRGRRRWTWVGGSVQLLPTPGHSDGSISIWDGATRASADLGRRAGREHPSRRRASGLPADLSQTRPYLETIAAIEALEAEWLLTAHEPVMRGAEATGFLARSRDVHHAAGRGRANASWRGLREALSTRAADRAAGSQVGSWDSERRGCSWPTSWSAISRSWRRAASSRLSQDHRRAGVCATGRQA